MDNKGFIATSLIYSFFLVFLALLAVILNSYVFNNRIMSVFNKSIMDKINRQIDSTSDNPSYSLEDLDILHIIPNTGTPNYNRLATSDEGVFISEDNDGKSYYYRGAVEDNFIIFGEWDSSDIMPSFMYWRIIRVNGDGSLRIMFYGYRSGKSIVKAPADYAEWNTTGNAQPYYNALEKKLDDFYIKKIYGTPYELSISDSGFCSTVTSSMENPANCSSRTGKIVCAGEEKDVVDFSDYDRIITLAGSSIGSIPSFKCNKENLYSVSSANGNGQLRYPIGLISSNEVVMAGSRATASNSTTEYVNTEFYLFNEDDYWTMSLYTKKTASGSGGTELMSRRYLNNAQAIPGGSTTTSNGTFIFTKDGTLKESDLNKNSYALYPVINLKEEYISTLKGDGTLSSPFIGELDREI